MTLFMDVHNHLPDGATPADVAAAHAADLKIQDGYGVKYLNYWVDAAGGRVFCLVEAPDADQAHAVHRDAHGLVADEIYPVVQGWAAMTTATGRPTITFAAAVHVEAPPEVTFGLLADPRTHLRWSGEQAPNDGFKLLTMDAPDGAGPAGTSFSSTGANGAGMTFQDRSVVTEASAPTVFAFRTDSRLVRKHRPTWQARFEHRYEVAPDGGGSRVGYRCEVYPVNYRPYWLHPLLRPMTRRLVPRMMVRNMRQLAEMAEQAAAGSR